MTKVVKARTILFVLALHQNGVEFCQQFIGAIINSLIASYDNVRCRAMSLSLLHTETLRQTQAAMGQNRLYSEVALAKKYQHKTVLN